MQHDLSVSISTQHQHTHTVTAPIDKLVRIQKYRNICKLTNPMHMPRTHHHSHTRISYILYLPLYKTLLNVLVIILSSAFGVSPIWIITDIPTMPWPLCCASLMLWYNSLLKPYNWIYWATQNRQTKNKMIKK